MGGSHRLGREPCTPTLVHGGTLKNLLLVTSFHRPLGTNLHLRRVLLRLVRPGTPGRVCVDVASSSTTGVSEEGSTLCFGESAGGGGEEAASVCLPFPQPPPAFPPLPVFSRPPLPLGTL